MNKKKSPNFELCLIITLLGSIIISSAVSCTSNRPRASKHIQSSDITRKRNVERVRIVKIGGNQNKVDIKITSGRAVLGSTPPRDIFLRGSSGVQQINQSANSLGHENTQFPFRGEIKFKYSTSSSSYYAKINYTITEPGNWVVSVYY